MQNSRDAYGTPRPRRVRRGGLARMLLLAFVPLVVGLVFLVGIAGLVVSTQTAERRVFDQLELVGTLKEEEVSRWLGERERDLAVLASEPILRQEATRLLDETTPDAERMAAYSNLGIRLSDFLNKKVAFAELFFLDANDGMAILSTDVLQEGRSHGEEAYFQSGLQGPVRQSPQLDDRLNVPIVFLARPVFQGSGTGGDGAILGVLVGRLNLNDLSLLMLEQAGLGESGETYLVDQDLKPLTRLRHTPAAAASLMEVTSAGARRAVLDQVDGSGRYENYNGTQVLGVYRWIPELGVALLAEISEAEAFRGRTIVVAMTSVLTVLAAGLVTGVIVFVSRRITRPITRLTEAATEMAAGDRSRRAGLARKDEIGALSQAFDDMADQVDELVGTLEERVAERTRDLERRALQLTTAADVGRAAASILDLELLAGEVVELVQERFDLYYAGLFLIDETGKYAVLEAGTGEAGQAMREQGHSLEVGGTSMVGQACQEHQIRVAQDVSKDLQRFDNPLLPETRSEMVLPLVVGGGGAGRAGYGDRVLGALDVQSTRQEAFSLEDIAVFRLVADQVAVAVDNAQKFSDAAEVLESSSPLFRISRRLAEATTPEEVAQAVVASIAETSAEGGAVARLERAMDGEVEAITFLASWNRRRSPRFPVRLSLPPSPAFPLSLATRRTIIKDVEQDDGLSEEVRQYLLTLGVQALALLPLRLGGGGPGAGDDRVLGFMVLDRGTPGQFSAAALQFYEALAEQAAMALERAQLLEESQQQAWREHVIRDISDRVTTSFDLDTLLYETLQEVGRVVGAAGGYIELGPPSVGE
ncbi:MAG: GAF domain-containing protein [Anaerolineae bacterium]